MGFASKASMVGIVPSQAFIQNIARVAYVKFVQKSGIEDVKSKHEIKKADMICRLLVGATGFEPVTPCL